MAMNPNPKWRGIHLLVIGCGQREALLGVFQDLEDRARGVLWQRLRIAQHVWLQPCIVSVQLFHPIFAVMQRASLRGIRKEPFRGSSLGSRFGNGHCHVCDQAS